MVPRVAVLLMDYGAPATDEQVRPFISALLSDPGMLPLPWGARQLLARWIAWRREERVVQRYRAIGGSPLPAWVGALSSQLGERLGRPFEVQPAYCFVAPRVDRVVAALAEDGVHRVLGVPLFPQRSTVTSDACQRLLEQACREHGLEAALTPDFPEATPLIDALEAGVSPLLSPETHVLMVAHGLPSRLEQAGDPYPGRVRATAAALAARLPHEQPWSLAFQSRVGRGAWTRPYLDDELERLAGEGVRDLLLAPLSFVAENLETRWDLDHEATERARELGMDRVVRAPAPGEHAALVELIHRLVCEAARGRRWLPARGAA